MRTFDVCQKYSKAAVLLFILFLQSCIINFKNEKNATKGPMHVDVNYIYPGKSQFNTYERYYKKEVQPGHYAETRLELDPGQQLLMLNKALTLHFYQMPDTFYH